jgi:hypothetical protein
MDLMAATNGHTTSLTAKALQTFNAWTARVGLTQQLGWLFDGRRKMHEVFGYKPALRYQDYKAQYLRGHLAHRLIKAYPEATWSQPPSVTEDNQEDTETAFEAAWDTLQQRLDVYGVLERTDVLANLGQYAVVVLRLKGQTDLTQPATPVRGPDDLDYLTPYSEEFATVKVIEQNPALPTFGQPQTYVINFDRQRSALRTGLVHASRIVHVAEDLLDDALYGIPRLEPIYNTLDDLMKITGGAAEMFYRDAKRRIALEVRDDYRLEPEDETALSDEIAEYMHDLKDFIRVKGVDVKDLSGHTVTSPKEHAAVLLDLIAATTGIPKRILFGNEAGQLASTQDEDAWLQRVKRRQVQFAEGRMLRPLVDRCITLGVLPAPAQPYTILWSNLTSLSEEQRAVVAKDVGTALNQYAPGMASTVVPPSEFREVYLGLKPVPDDVPELVLPGPEEL